MPKLENLRKILILFFILVMVFSLTGCNNSIEDKKNNKKEKVNQEMKYLDEKIITIMNKLNNISFSNYKIVAKDVKEEKSSVTSGDEKSLSDNKDSESSTKEEEDNKENESKEKSSSKSDSSSSKSTSLKNFVDNQIFQMTEELILTTENKQDNKIEWDEIVKDIENIYTIWPTISLDLENLGINYLDIAEFNNILDDIGINVKNKNKELSLLNLSKIYNLIPKYMEVYSDDNLVKKIIITKSFILNAYVFADLEKWDEVNKNIEMSENSFSWIIQNKQNYTEKELNINRSNILIADLKNSIDKHDKQIFFVRYKNLLQELNSF